MKLCLSCQSPIPNKTKVGNKIFHTQSRKFCITCSPIGLHNTRNLLKPRRSRGSYADVKKFRKNKKQRCLEYLGGVCKICGYNRCPDALQFHHKDPSLKDFSISAAGSWGFERVKSELDKCVLLCANCHSEVHAGLVLLDGDAPST